MNGFKIYGRDMAEGSDGADSMGSASEWCMGKHTEGTFGLSQKVTIGQDHDTPASSTGVKHDAMD